jgi:hypothetical protein
MLSCNDTVVLEPKHTAHSKMDIKFFLYSLQDGLISASAMCALSFFGRNDANDEMMICEASGNSCLLL